MSDRVDPGTKIFFRVSIDGLDLGVFDTCDGLGAEVEIQTWEEGGTNGHVWHLPTRVKHPNITLSRGLTKDTQKITLWISAVAKSDILRPTAQIIALQADGTEICQWGLEDVLPVRWTGPSFDVSSPTVATETLEIAHHGFIDAGGS